MSDAIPSRAAKCDKPHANDPDPCNECGYPGDPCGGERPEAVGVPPETALAAANQAGGEPGHEIPASSTFPYTRAFR